MKLGANHPIGPIALAVIMGHVNKNGKSKIKKECTLPLTGQHVIHRLITDLAVFDFTNEGMVLVEILGDASRQEIKEKKEARLLVASNFIAAL